MQQAITVARMYQYRGVLLQNLPGRLRYTDAATSILIHPLEHVSEDILHTVAFCCLLCVMFYLLQLT